MELAKHGVRVNAVCPGAIDTPIQHKTVKRDVEKEKEPVVFPRKEHAMSLTHGMRDEEERERERERENERAREREREGMRENGARMK